MRNKRRTGVSVGCLIALLVNCVSGYAQSNQQQPPKEPARVGGVVVGPQGEGQRMEVRIERDGGPFPPGAEFVVGPPGFGNTFSFVSTEMSFDTKVVKGVPFSADAVNESTQTLSDGNRIVRRTSTSLYRDNEGRTRREQSLGGVGPWATAGDGPQRVFINDPVSGFNYVLDPRAQVARKITAPRLRTAAPAMTRSTAGPGQPPGAITLSGGVLQGAALKKFQPEYPPIAKAAGAEGAVQVMVVINETGQVEVAQVVSGHPLLREAALEAAKKWVFKPTELSGKPVKVQGTLTFNFTLDKPKAPGEQPMVVRTDMSNVEKMETRKESLGKQKFEGVEAEGERTVNTIPAGAIGNERPIEIVFERWYSPELQTVIMTRHSDPRTGENVYRLVNVNRSEPAAHLFTVPSDYTVKEEPGEVRTMMRKLQDEK